MPHFCPNIVRRVLLDLGDSGLSYWIQLGGTQASKNHENCTASRCSANNVGSSAPHIEPSCQCALIGPQMHEIARITDLDMIPVIAVEGTLDNCRVIVETYRPGLVFAAISHT